MRTTERIAVEIDHAKYQRKVKVMTENELLWTIADCKGALAAMPDSQKAGYYQDEIYYCAAELRRRRIARA